MSAIDGTHDPARWSWVGSARDHPDFPVQNLPLGVASAEGRDRIVVAIGSEVLDLAAAGEAGLLPDAAREAVAAPTLNRYLALPISERSRLRHRLSELLSDLSFEPVVAPLLRPVASVVMRLPASIGDYTDFYVGIHHARNVGALFRPDAPLLPNYRHVPIGYHGRASSVRVSGTPVRRPSGQRRPADAAEPTFGPSERLDYELELGFWIGGEPNALGEPVPIGRASERVAGVCLLNDWSARDVQAWEYQPLGPFLSKSFLTTVSPWMVTTEALAPFRVPQPARPDGDPLPLPYLWDDGDQAAGAFAIRLEVHLSSEPMRELGLPPTRLSVGPATNMYWTVAQMVAHHASNGCDLRAGDLLGSGTISGPGREALGSMLEIGRGGVEPVRLPSGETRAFLEAGDEVTMTARATAPGRTSIGFGQCVGIVAG